MTEPQENPDLDEDELEDRARRFDDEENLEDIDDLLDDLRDDLETDDEV